MAVSAVVELSGTVTSTPVPAKLAIGTLATGLPAQPVLAKIFTVPASGALPVSSGVLSLAIRAGTVRRRGAGGGVADGALTPPVPPPPVPPLGGGGGGGVTSR